MQYSHNYRSRSFQEFRCAVLINLLYNDSDTARIERFWRSRISLFMGLMEKWKIYWVCAHSRKTCKTCNSNIDV